MCDITNIENDANFPIKESQVDLIVIIFVLSAIKPEKYESIFLIVFVKF